MSRNELRQKWWTRPLGHLIWLFISLISHTLRFRIDKLTRSRLQQQQQVIVALWHNRIFTPCHAYRFHIRGQAPMCLLTSASKDGAMLSTIAEHYGMHTVRGSSRRRGAIAFRDMVHELDRGCSICITPDGPKGPLYKCHPGVIKLASVSGVSIIPISIRYSCAWRLPTWDRFFIPLPFSRVELTSAEPIHIPADLTPEQLSAWCAKLESLIATD